MLCVLGALEVLPGLDDLQVLLTVSLQMNRMNSESEGNRLCFIEQNVDSSEAAALHFSDPQLILPDISVVESVVIHGAGHFVFSINHCETVQAVLAHLSLWSALPKRLVLMILVKFPFVKAPIQIAPVGKHQQFRGEVLQR
jgi:hypothetical protein